MASPTVTTISLPRAKGLLTAWRNKKKSEPFTVLFLKKDGSRRVMDCTFEDKSELLVGNPAYNPKDYDLINVWSVKDKGWRSIQLKTLMSIVMGDKTYLVVEAKP